MDYTLAELRKPKDGKWYVYYSYRNPADGKLKPFKIRENLNRISEKKQKTAYGVEVCGAINEKLKSGWSPFINLKSKSSDPFLKLNIIDLFNEFLKIKKASVRKDSYKTYKYSYGLFKAYMEGQFMQDLSPENFSSSMAQYYSDYLVTTKGLSGKTHNNQLLSMNNFFNMAIDREILLKSPFKKIKKKPVDESRNLAFTNIERDKIKNFLIETKNPLFMFVQFLYYGFLRPKETINLKVRNINFKDRSIIIYSKTSKTRSQSSVSIPDAFIGLITEMYSSMDENIYLFSENLVPGYSNKHRDIATRAHRAVLDELGMSETGHTLYAWKHTGNVAAYEAGMDLLTIMRQNRHSNPQQTMTYLRTIGIKMKTEFSSKQPAF